VPARSRSDPDTLSEDARAELLEEVIEKEVTAPVALTVAMIGDATADRRVHVSSGALQTAMVRMAAPDRSRRRGSRRSDSRRRGSRRR